MEEQYEKIKIVPTSENYDHRMIPDDDVPGDTWICIDCGLQSVGGQHLSACSGIQCNNKKGSDAELDEDKYKKTTF